MGCFSDDFLAAYLERTVSPGELAAAEEHLEVCGDCRAHVAAFARLAARDPEATRRDPVTRLADPPQAIEPAAGLVGRTVANRYVIESRLGGGGMGVVYQAHDQLMERRVAIKVISPRFGHNTQAEPRFLRECRLAARISHLNAVMVLDHGRLEEGQLYLAMELLVGRTLHEHLRAGPLSEPRALHIASQICDALDAAHRLRIIHRDLKPANIVILDDPPGRDTVKVLDFGIARSLEADDGELTRTNVAIGTPAFSAPEVLVERGVAVDERADLYSLGVVLSWMLAGKPGSSETGGPGLPADRPRLHHVRVELADLVEQLLQADPDRRPTSAAEVRARLGEMQAAPTPAPSWTAPSAPAVRPPEPRPRGRRALAIALALASAALVALVSLAVWATADSSDRPSTPAVTASPARVVSPTPAPDAAPVAIPDAGVVAAAPPDAAPEPRRKKRPPRRRSEKPADRPAKASRDRPARDRPEYFRP